MFFCPAPRVTCRLSDLLLHLMVRAEPCRSSHLLEAVSREAHWLLQSSPVFFKKKSCMSSSSQSNLAKKARTGSWTSAHRNKCVSIVQPFLTVHSNPRTDFSTEKENIKFQTFLRIFIFLQNNNSFSPQESKMLYFLRIHPWYSISEFFS